MGISNDIMPKHLPRRKLEERNIAEIADKAGAFDVDLLQDPPEPEVELSSKEGDKETKKKSNDRLADEFFDKKQFKDSKKAPAMTESNETASQKEPNKKTFLLNIGFLWTLFVVLVGILVWQNFAVIKKIFIKDSAPAVTTSKEPASTTTEETTTPTQTTETETTPATTPVAATTPAVTTPAVTTPTIDKAAIKIKVLNGNGVTGRAATVSSLLTTAGFKITSTTNAKKFTYATTIIYFHEGKQAEANLVKDALPTYSVTTVMDNTVVGTSDLVVVVGKK
ncbi:MAG: LytR C-terminal domain-containing protein [Patescibacteria group bacterium]|jgi:cytoskeletal protein RodZ